MTYRDIYAAAICLMGNNPVSAETKYEEKSQRLLPMVVISLLPIDRIIKKNSGDEPTAFPDPEIELSDAFPLPESFMPAAAHYLACELTAPEDPDASSELYARAEAQKRILQSSIPFVYETAE